MVRISAVDTKIVRVPFTHGDDSTVGRAGNLRLSTLNTLLVRVTTDTGIIGWGEAFGFDLVDVTKAAIDRLVSPLCIGHDVADAEGLNAILSHRLHNYGRNGPVSFGISGIDIALWDIAGKLAGLPLHRLLGDGGKDIVPAYTSLLRYGDAATVESNVRLAVSRGYRAIKLHEIELAVIRAGRNAAPDSVSLMLDVNCHWAPPQAITFARSLQKERIFFIEEPIWPPEDMIGLGQVSAQSGIPIAAGENATLMDFHTMITTGAVRFVQPSVTKIGISGLLKVVAWAAEHGVLVSPHSPYFGPGLLATVQVAAASKHDIAVERYGVELAADLFDGAITPVNGRISVPPKPGLGIDPSEDVIARFG